MTDKAQDQTDGHTGDEAPEQAGARVPVTKAKKPKEIGGPPGPEPTRYGDWESKGRCTDF